MPEPIQRICAACHEPITDEERWFRLREDYVHLACSERFMRQLAERRREQKAAPSLDVPETGE